MIKGAPEPGRLLYDGKFELVALITQQAVRDPLRTRLDDEPVHAALRHNVTYRLPIMPLVGFQRKATGVIRNLATQPILFSPDAERDLRYTPFKVGVLYQMRDPLVRHQPGTIQHIWTDPCRKHILFFPLPEQLVQTIDNGIQGSQVQGFARHVRCRRTGLNGR